MKTAALTLAALALLAGPATAGDCDEAIARIDAALTGADVSPDVKAQVQDMRSQAAELCSAGNDEEGADILAEAAALLGIE